MSSADRRTDIAGDDPAWHLSKANFASHLSMVEGAMRFEFPTNGILCVVVIMASAHAAHAQREGWWATASGGVVNVAQSCPPDALSDSCGPRPDWGLGPAQLGVGRALSASLMVGLEVGRRSFTTHMDQTRQSEAASTVFQLAATAFPEPQLPMYLQVGVGGGRYRVVDRFGPTASLEGKGTLWAASVTLGAEWDLVGPLRVGPYGRLDYAEFAGVGDFFERLHQRLVSFGVAVTLR